MAMMMAATVARLPTFSEIEPVIVYLLVLVSVFLDQIGWRSPGGGSISWDWFGFWCKVYFC